MTNLAAGPVEWRLVDVATPSPLSFSLVEETTQALDVAVGKRRIGIANPLLELSIHGARH